MEVRLSWASMLAVVALLYVLVRGLANPRTRPFVIGLGAFVGLAVVFVGFLAVPMARQRKMAQVEEQMTAQEEHMTAQAQAQMAAQNREQAEVLRQEQQRRITARPKNSATETALPKMTLIAALRQAIVQAWIARGSVPIAEAPEKPAKASQPDVRTLAMPPAWVNAPAKMQDDGSYVVSARVGPFTSPLECERELPKALRAIVTDYAELALGGEAAAVSLPDDALPQLVHQRWSEVRPMEIGDTTQDMYTLHVLVVFDDATQKQIKAGAGRLVIDRRVRGAAAIFGGMLGVLALTWGGLKWLTRRQEKNKVGPTPEPSLAGRPSASAGTA